jgi:hypothetical protein
MHNTPVGASHFGRMVRLVVVPLLTALVAALVLASSATAGQERTAGSIAGAKDPLLLTTAVPVHGVAEDGTVFNGIFRLKRFDARDGVLYAVGKLEGVLGASKVHKNVRLPVTGAVSEPNPATGTTGIEGPSGFRQQPVPTPGACDLLTLALGPLDLDLLGLRVALDEVNLLLEAIPGAGNLVGNLLCAVAGLLDPGPIGLPGLIQGLLDAIANLLNGLLGGL